MTLIDCSAFKETVELTQQFCYTGKKETLLDT